MAIKTKSVYAPGDAGDGARVLVTRFHPRGVKTRFDRWERDLAPSAQLLARYRGGGATWEQFVPLYKRELLGNPAGLRALESLRSESAAGDVTLLCYEPDGAPCHRHLLREMARDPRLLRADFAPVCSDDIARQRAP